MMTEGEDQANETEAVATDAPDDKETIDVVTTAIGTFGVDGIAPIGTRRAIHYSAFAESWMKPANLMSTQRLKKLQKRDENGA